MNNASKPDNKTFIFSHPLNFKQFNYQVICPFLKSHNTWFLILKYIKILFLIIESIEVLIKTHNGFHIPNSSSYEHQQMPS